MKDDNDASTFLCHAEPSQSEYEVGVDENDDDETAAQGTPSRAKRQCVQPSPQPRKSVQASAPLQQGLQATPQQQISVQASAPQQQAAAQASPLQRSVQASTLQQQQQQQQGLQATHQQKSVQASVQPQQQQQQQPQATQQVPTQDLDDVFGQAPAAKQLDIAHMFRQTQAQPAAPEVCVCVRVCSRVAMMLCVYLCVSMFRQTQALPAAPEVCL